MGKYDDIINLPHHQSATRAHMSMHDRAAQFAPFAALKGYDEAVVETARPTDSKIQLDENKIEKLDFILQYLSEEFPNRHNITVTYFIPDTRKQGGAYIDKIGTLKKIDEIERKLIFTDQQEIFIDDIFDIKFDNE